MIIDGDMPFFRVRAKYPRSKQHIANLIFRSYTYIYTCFMYFRLYRQPLLLSFGKCSFGHLQSGHFTLGAIGRARRTRDPRHGRLIVFNDFFFH